MNRKVRVHEIIQKAGGPPVSRLAMANIAADALSKSQRKMEENPLSEEQDVGELMVLSGTKLKVTGDICDRWIKVYDADQRLWIALWELQSGKPVR